jgi:hypothetical protein
MKYLYALLALVTFSCFTSALHADPIVSLQTGTTADNLIETPVLGGQQYIYSNTTTNVFQTTNQTFVATFTDIAGVILLNVTDLCVNLNIFAPAQPCKALAFSFTDASLGTAAQLFALGTASANISGDVIGVNFGASIGGGSAEFNFPNPPAATPEPGSLALLGTGVLGLAGTLRKRFVA